MKFSVKCFIVLLCLSSQFAFSSVKVIKIDRNTQNPFHTQVSLEPNDVVNIDFSYIAANTDYKIMLRAADQKPFSIVPVSDFPEEPSNNVSAWSSSFSLEFTYEAGKPLPPQADSIPQWARASFLADLHENKIKLLGDKPRTFKIEVSH